MKCRRLNTLCHRPVNGAIEHRQVIVIHAKDKTGVDHHPQVVTAFGRPLVVFVQVVKLANRLQVFLTECLKSDK